MKYRLNLNTIIWAFKTNYNLKKVFLLFIIVCLSDSLYYFSKSVNSSMDILLYCLQGYGLGYFQLIDLLHLIIIYLSPVYISYSIFEKAHIKEESHILIRCENRKLYYFMKTNSIQLFIIIVVFIRLLCVLINVEIHRVPYSPFKPLFRESVVDLNKCIIIVFLSFVLNYFEYLVIIRVIVVLETFIYNETYAFVIMIIGYLMLPFIHFKSYPFGFSSLLRFYDVANPLKYCYCSLLMSVIMIIMSDIYMIKIGIRKVMEK